MTNISNKTLSILSLLIIPGLLTIDLFEDGLVLIPFTMCAISGLSFGTLLGRK